MSKIFNSIVMGILVLLGSTLAASAQKTKPSIKKNIINSRTPGYALIPKDPSLKTGKLSNGLTYYIRQNKEPKNRVTMYLVVKAGSILEAENQRGLAHFVEHMSFNGTTNFPKNELVDYLQKSGIRFGADLNAYTSFDETVYQLPIPTEDPVILQHGLQILRDWAQNATLEKSELDSERGVILEEKRLRLGLSQRIQEHLFAGTVNYSKYKDRLPIGTEQVLKQFKPELIESFYRDWYRPDLQAVIIVGDINVEKIETEVRRLFGSLKVLAKPRTRLSYDIPLDGKNKFTTFSDVELQQTTVDVTYKFREIVNRTEADLKQSISKLLFSNMLSARLSETARKPNAPYLQLSSGFGSIAGGLEGLTISVTPRKGDLKKGFEAAWKEIVQVKKYGFTPQEFDRANASLRSGIESSFIEKDKQSSASLADQYKLNFLKGESIPGAEQEYILLKRLIPQISLATVNKLVPTYFKNLDRDITITAPASEKENLPELATVLDWMSNAAQSKLTLYTEVNLGAALIPTLPVKGKVIAEKAIPEIGVTEWTLSNGAKVVLKPTDFMNDEISFLALSPGGTSLYPDIEYQSAKNSASLTQRFGLGSFDNISLSKVLNGKQLAVNPFVSETFEGISGGSSVKDFHVSMELLNLYFTAPRTDSALFNSLMRDSKSQIINRYKNPDAIFADTVSAVLGNYNVRRTGPTLEKMNAIELEKVTQIYKERFADAGDFTFFFVGNFKVDSIRNEIEQYIASLPATKSKESIKDLGIHIPSGKRTKIVNAGTENKASVRLVFSGSYVYNDKNNLMLSALQEILNFRLLDRLREKEGGVYSPGVNASYNKLPSSRYSFNMTFGCDPMSVDKLVEATLDEINKLKTDGITISDLQKFRVEQERQNELSIKNNSFWLNYLSDQYVNGEDPTALLGTNALLKQLNAKELQDAFVIYFNQNDYIKFELMPVNTK